MKLRIVTVSSRAPQWIKQGYEEYARRMPREFSLDLIEVKPEPRSGADLSAKEILRLKQAEAARLRAHLADFETVVALDERGRMFSTMTLSNQLRDWQTQSHSVAFLIGGADGLAEDLRESARLQMSLSPLTLPHQLVRVILAEQLYRAVSILNNHPYHRA
jgi:23S rRNA (pseudouridine1915-N3)-methyltransferase